VGYIAECLASSDYNGLVGSKRAKGSEGTIGTRIGLSHGFKPNADLILSNHVNQAFISLRCLPSPFRSDKLPRNPEHIMAVNIGALTETQPGILR